MPPLLVPLRSSALVAVHPPAPDEHSPSVYLASLATGSRRAMQSALETIAALLTSGRCTALTLPWPLLRAQHTLAVRAALAECYAPATANKMLSALRGTLKAAWRLGQMATDDYQRAIDLPPVRGETLPRGRALQASFARCSKRAPMIRRPMERATRRFLRCCMAPDFAGPKWWRSTGATTRPKAAN